MKYRYFIALILMVSTILPAVGQVDPQSAYADSLKNNLILLKRYLSHGDNWRVADKQNKSRLNALVQFIENEPLDTILVHLGKFSEQPNARFVFRLPEEVPDSLNVPGYFPAEKIANRNEQIVRQVNSEFSGRQVEVPAALFAGIERRLPLIPEGEGMALVTDGIISLPDSLRTIDAIPDHMIQNPDDFKRLLRLDSIRSALVERRRIAYNDSLINAEQNRIAMVYTQQLMAERVRELQKELSDSVRLNNYQVLKHYNDEKTIQVNDSITKAVGWLSEFANLIDNTTVNLVNLTNQSSPLVLSDAGQFFTRVWLKNQQNDSLSVLVQSLGKRSLQLAIEDAVIFTRFRQQSVKDFDFATLNRPSVNLDKVGARFQAYTPWTVGGDGAVGFTQTYLENWKKGGKSALAIQLVAKGFANYSHGKIKWENSGEIRNGWIKPGEELIQKNDDKFQVTSRFGMSAFQKWYYSTEADFETQFFNGYKYPNREKPISAFLSPGRFMFKLGLDYKPNKNFSLFISPLTSKTVFINDTAKVSVVNYGIDKGKTSYWEPGLNTDLKFKKEFAGNITYETKYRMFLNYREPFKQFDVDWENLIAIQLNNYIALRMMLHTIYDTKVLFDKLDGEGKPILDADGKKIREPKLQLKEFMTIGFSYKINRRVTRARQI